MPNLYFTPQDISPTSYDDWYDADVSSWVPRGASGVILHFDNTNAGSSMNVGWRMNGSTDNRTEVMGYDSHHWAAIGIDDARKLELYLDSADVVVYLVGYFQANEAEFFANGVDKSISGTGWQNVDISGDCDETAIGAILEIQNTGAYKFGLRMDGSSDNRVEYPYYHLGAIIGCSSEIFEGNIANDAIDWWLNGYIISGSKFNSTAPDLSIGGDDLNEWIDLNNLGDGKSVCYYVEVTASVFSYFGLRKNGSSENITQNASQKPWGIVGADANGIIEGIIGATTTDFWLSGEGYETLSKNRSPTGDGVTAGSVSVYPASPTTHYDKVDEDPADDATTYIELITNAAYSMFTFSAFDVPAGAPIQSLRIYYKGFDIDGTSANNLRSCLRVNSTNYLTTDPGFDPSASQWDWNYYDYTVNPNTSSAWLAEDINGSGSNPLQQFGVYSSDANKDVACTNVFAVVYYKGFVNLVGTAAGGSTAVATVSVPVIETLAGTSAGACTVSNIPAMKATRELIGTSDGLSTAVVAGMKCTFDMAGTSDGACTVTNIPAMKATRGLIGTSAGGATADATVEVGGIQEIAGTSDGLSTAGAAVKVEKTFIGLSSGVGATSPPPNVKVTKKFVGTSDGLSTAVATVSVGGIQELAGTSVGTSTAAGINFKRIRIQTIQPLDHDTVIKESSGENHGADNDVHVRSSTGAYCYRAIVEDDISGVVPADSTIVKADWMMYCYSATGGAGGRTAEWNRLTEPDWVEGDNTDGCTYQEYWHDYDSHPGSCDSWASEGGDYTTTGKVNSTIPSSAAWQTWDLTALAQDALDNRSGRLMGLIKLTDADENYDTYEAKWWSRENGTPALDPKLVLEWTPPRTLIGTSAGGSTAEATLEVSKNMAGTSAGACTVANIPAIKITLKLIGTSDGVCVVSNIPAMTAIRELLAASDGLSTADTGLDVEVRLIATSDGGSTADATLDVEVHLIGDSAGGSTAIATVETGQEELLAGTSDGVCTVSNIPTLEVTRKLSGTSDGICTVSNIPALQAIRELIGTSDGATTVANTFLDVTKKLAGTADGVCAVANIPAMQAIRELAGDSDGLSTALATLLETTDLAGTSDGLSTADAVAKILKELAGASAGESTADATVEETTDLGPGTSDGLSTADAVLKVTKELAGVTDGVTTVANIPAMTAIRELVATSDGVGNVPNVLLKSTVPLVGTSDGGSTAIATVDTSIPIAGTSDGACTVSDIPALKAVREITSSIACSSTADASLKVTKELIGDSDGLSIAIATLTESTLLAGTSDGGSTADATLDASVPLAGTSDGLSTAIATLEEATLLAGTSDGLSTAGAVLKVLKELAGTSDGVTTVANIPELKVSLELAATSDGVATVANIPAMQAIRELVGVSDGLSTSDASIKITKELVGTSDGGSTAIANVEIQGTQLIGGTSDGSSTADATLRGTWCFAATSDGLSTADASLAVTKELAGVSDGLSTADALVKVTKELAGASFALSTVNGTLSPIRGLAGASDGIATVADIAIKVTRNLVATSDGLSTALATLSEATLLAGVSDGLSTATAVIKRLREIAGTADGIATADTSLSVEVHLSGTSDGTSTAQAYVLTGNEELLAGISGGTSTATVALTILPYRTGSVSVVVGDGSGLTVSKRIVGTVTVTKEPEE